MQILREGVELIQGREHQGSAWCIRDCVQDKEWNISPKMAAYLSNGTKTNKIDQQTIDNYQKALEKIKVLKGSEIPAGPKGINAQHLVSQKIVLLKPDEWLKRHPKIVAAAFQPAAYLLLSILAVIALMTVYSQWTAFYQYKDTYLDAAIAIIIALAITKALHEFGHAFAISHSKGKVNGMGIALIAGMPLPKTDASLLAHAPRRDLLKIATAGIYFELWAAILATIIWGGAEDGVIRSALHLVAVVSLAITLAANALPLMKFDGYYVISAITGEPRLYEESIGIFRQYVFKAIGKESPDTVRHVGTAKAIRGLYGAAIFSWKVFLPIGIMLALRWYFPDSNIGYIAGALPIYPMWIKPAIAEVRKISNAENSKGAIMNRAITITITLLALAWLIVPMNHIQNAPGAITRDRYEIKSQIEGTAQKVHMKGAVEKGELIVEIAASDQALISLTELEERAQAIETQLSSGNLTENINILSTQKMSVAAERVRIEQQINQGNIIASESGYYQPLQDPGTVQIGATIGYLYPSYGSGHLSVYMQPAPGLTNTVEALLQLPDGSTEKVSLYKELSHASGAAMPEWREEINSDNLAIYKSERSFKELPEMPVKVIYKRKYSIAKEWISRYLTRLIY